MPDETEVQPDDETINPRWILNGARSLDEAAAFARIFAAELDDLCMSAASGSASR